MTKDEKKEAFLQIIENWFEDKTGDINSENCIGFYNYLIDSLEFESRFYTEYELKFNKFIKSISDWLSTFNVQKNKSYIYEKDGLKNLSSKLLGKENQAKLELFLSILSNIYICSKNEYLL